MLLSTTSIPLWPVAVAGVEVSGLKEGLAVEFGLATVQSLVP